MGRAKRYRKLKRQNLRAKRYERMVDHYCTADAKALLNILPVPAPEPKDLDMIKYFKKFFDLDLSESQQELLKEYQKAGTQHETLVPIRSNNAVVGGFVCSNIENILRYMRKEI